jgi:pimeloyl-ACP methyl ester carboxylesterase
VERVPDAPLPFTAQASPAALEDLRTRLRATRWPDAPEDAGWSIGTDLSYLRELVAYWADGFDWPAQEAALARLARFRVERRFSEDEILTNVTIYWLTGTIGSSMRMYHANAAIPPAQHARRVEVPSGFSLFPADISHPPREWLERTANVARVTELPRGGHFAPFEEPELYAQELREFFRPYRTPTAG